MLRSLRSRIAREQGAIVIYVAVAVLALTAFTTFAVDYGILWTARAQAQTVADFAAHAGAVALAYDDFTDDASGATAATGAARTVAGTMKVFNQTPGDSSVDVSFPACPDGTLNCVKVDVYRDTAHSNALPAFFGRLLGVTGQNVQATATAQAQFAGGNDCLAPFAVPDKWIESWDAKKGENKTKEWKAGSTFDGYCEQKGDTIDMAGCSGSETPDVYVPPFLGETNPTGYRFLDVAKKKSGGDIGRKMTIDDIKRDPLSDFTRGIDGKSYIPLDLPRKDGQSGASAYGASIMTCNGTLITIGQYVNYLGDPKTLGDAEMKATDDAIDALIAMDPGAYFDVGKKSGNTYTVKGSCAQANPPCAEAKNGLSPRILAVPVFNTKLYEDCRFGRNGCSPSQLKLQVSNIIGVFISKNKDKKGEDDGKFEGYIIPIPGVHTSGGLPIDRDFSFLRTIGMVR